MPRPFIAPAAALLGLLVALVLPAAASAAVTVQPPADVVEEIAADVTIAGTTAQSGRRVWGRYLDGNVPCPSAYTSAAGGTPLEFADRNVPAGTWTKTTKLAVTVAGTYTLCAWVGPDVSFPDEPPGRAVVAVRRGTAQIAFDLPADPVAEVTQQLTVRGTSELNRDLDVAVLPGDVACPAVPPADGRTIRQQTVNGAFAHTADIRRETPGTFTACAWVKDFHESVPNGTARQTMTFRAPRATVSVTGPTTYTTRQSFAFTASGATEASRRLWVIVADGDGCAPTAGAQAGSFAIPGEPVAAGAFTRGTGTQGKVGRHIVCVYVGTEDRTDAAAQHRYTVTLDPRDDEFANAEAEVQVPAPVLAGPVDRLRSKATKPLFAWASEEWHGEDTLVLTARDRNGKLTRLVDLGETYAVVHHGATRVKAKTKTLARATYDGAQRTVQLKQPLPPGDYVWWVARQPPSVEPLPGVRSAGRSFTVEGEKLGGRLVTRVSREPGRFRAVPGWSVVGVRTAPFARVRFAVRGGAGSGTYTTIADAEGLAFQQIGWTCSRPGTKYGVTVRVSDQYGASRTKRLVTRGRRARAARGCSPAS